MGSAAKVFNKTVLLILLGLQVFALLPAAVAGDTCWLEPDCPFGEGHPAVLLLLGARVMVRAPGSSHREESPDGRAWENPAGNPQDPVCCDEAELERVRRFGYPPLCPRTNLQAGSLLCSSREGRVILCSAKGLSATRNAGRGFFQHQEAGRTVFGTLPLTTCPCLSYHMSVYSY